jgi:hypothetical protein
MVQHRGREENIKRLFAGEGEEGDVEKVPMRTRL